MLKGWRRGCFTLVVAGLLATGVAYAGLSWGERAFPGLGGFAESAGPEPTPELAEATLVRLDAFRTGRSGEERLSLGGTELSSVVRYSVPGLLPAGVQDPTVAFQGDYLLLSARVAVAAFPDIPALRDVLGLLPDTVEIQMRGSLRPFDPAFAALHVERVEAARIPLPERMFPEILAALGRRDRQGLPSDAMVVPLPQGVGGAYVENEQLILVAEG